MNGDCIRLTGLTFYGYHGVHAEERVLGQRFVVDLELAVDLDLAGRSDDLTATVDYSGVYRLVRDIVEGPPSKLIEAVAEQIARDLLRSTPARSVLVRVRKPWAPVRGMVNGEVSVEIVRRTPTGPEPQA